MEEGVGVEVGVGMEKGGCDFRGGCGSGSGGAPSWNLWKVRGGGLPAVEANLKDSL